jgi:hypothetical protein
MEERREEREKKRREIVVGPTTLLVQLAFASNASHRMRVTSSPI